MCVLILYQYKLNLGLCIALSEMVLMWGIGSCVSRCVECLRIFRGCKKGCRKNDSCYGIPLMVCVAAMSLACREPGPHTLFDAHLSLSECVSGGRLELVLHVQSHLIISLCVERPLNMH